jgi:hypothetical protein
LLNRLDGLRVSREELFPEEFESYLLLRIFERSGKIDFRSVAFS